MATDKAGRWIGVRSGFGDFNMSDLGPNEKVMASVLHDGGWTVMRKVAEASTGEQSPEAQECDSCLQLIGERDNAEEWADKLAGEIARYFKVEIGEHSNVNNPWAEAYEAVLEVGSVGESPAPATEFVCTEHNKANCFKCQYIGEFPAERVAATPEPTLTHGMNCSALGNWDAECTCGLEWRIRLQTEREMHNAWRKRAEEAEAKLSTLEQTLLELRTLIDKARRFTASDPDNQWCRQATIVLNYAITGNAKSGESRQ